MALAARRAGHLVSAPKLHFSMEATLNMLKNAGHAACLLRHRVGLSTHLFIVDLKEASTHQELVIL